MKILVTNDDGFHAPGLVALVKRLKQEHDVFVAAPDRERSAIGHAITLQMPIRAVEINNGISPCHAITGTPADCVKLAVLELLDEPPDMVVSGINPGPNVGVNLNYSGTVSAAKEGTLLGIPSIAISIAGPQSSDFTIAANFAARLCGIIKKNKLPKGVFLNVNLPSLPDEKIKGVRVCSQGSAKMEETFHKRLDPRDRPYYWQGSQTRLFGEKPDEDGVALRENFIAVTPVKCDMTEYDFMKKMETWQF